MKMINKILVIYGAFLSALVADDNLLQLSASAERQISENIELFVRHVNTGDVDGIYKGLGSLIKANIPETEFGLRINKAWKIRDIAIVNYEIFSDGAYLVVHLREYDGKDEVSAYKVWFWEQSNGQWRPQNFPFRGSSIPNFVRTPECLSSGLRTAIDSGRCAK